MSFPDTELPSYAARRLRAGEAAGVVLFEPNAPSAASLRRLTRQVQRAAGGSALVAVDQEGGDIRSVRFAPPREAQPSQPDPGAAAAAAARGLLAVGVNVNLAPVSDLSGPGSVVAGRAYPGRPAAVTRSVRASVREHGRGGVAATAKHFPGLGDATVNTDDGPAVVESHETAPFAGAIAEGVPLVMASHALYPRLDGRRIASQSPAVLERLLRDRLGFRGVVVTDSMEAQAVLDRSPIERAAVRSVAAGADLLLLTGSASAKLVFAPLLRAAQRDPAFRARVREAATRVLALKRRLRLRSPAPRRAP